MMVDKICLYRCWTHNGVKMQSCYPSESGFVPTLDKGQTIKEPIKSSDGKFNKVTAIACKYPDCL